MINTIFFALLVLSAIADAWTTIRFLKAGEAEGMPAGKWFHATFGDVPGTILAKALQVALLVGLAAIAAHFGEGWSVPLIYGIGIALNVWAAIGNLD